MHKQSWFALLAPFVVFAQGPPEITCDLPTTGPEVCAYGPAKPITLEAIKLCLDTLELSPEDMGVAKLNNLLFVSMLLNAGYSFGDLIRDSEDSPMAELSQSYKEAPISWSRYNQSVPWVDDLTAIAEDNGTNIFDYTNQVFKVLRLFDDAHTELQEFMDVYPFILAWPYNLGSRVAEDGVTQELYFTANRNGGLSSEGYNEVVTKCAYDGYEAVSDESFMNKTIATVNGVSALDHFKTMASYMGSYKSPGAQFNAFLTGGGGTVIEAMRIPNFRTDMNSTIWNIEWDDGTTASVKPFVYMVAETTTEQIIELGTTPRSEFDKAVITVFNRENAIVNSTDVEDIENAPQQSFTPDEVDEAVVNNTRRSMRDTSRSINQIVARELARHRNRRQEPNPYATDDVSDVPVVSDTDSSEDASETAQVPVSPDVSEDVSETPQASAESSVADGVPEEATETQGVSEGVSETEGVVEDSSEPIAESDEVSQTQDVLETLDVSDQVSDTQAISDQTSETLDASAESSEVEESEPVATGSEFPETPLGVISDVDFEPEAGTPSEHVLLLQSGVGAVYNYSGTPIIKYPSFLNEEMGSDEFEAASMALFEYVSANFVGKDNKLIIDISSNGGGYVDVMYNFVYALMSQTLDRRLCPSLDIRQSELVTAWVNMTMEPPEKLGDVNDEEAALFKEILELAFNFIAETAPDKVQAILATFQQLTANGQISQLIDEDAFREVLEDIEKIMDLNPTDRAIFINTFRETLLAVITEYIPSIIWLGIPPIATEIGYAPVGSEEVPQSMIPAEEFWVTKANNYTRGGIASMYSQKYTSCTIQMRNYSTENLGDYGEIVLLTDGNCGSACGQFMNTLQSVSSGAYPDLPALNVTTVSWGGIVGEELSVNAFEGGNVLKDTAFLQELYTNGFLLAPLYLTGDDLEVQLEKYDAFLEALPLPFNNGMVNSFNFRESYTQTAGNDSLPSEFYSKPAMFHRNEWYYELSQYTEPAMLYSQSIEALYTDLANGDYGTPTESK